jgi:hypothetical protein
MTEWEWKHAYLSCILLLRDVMRVSPLQKRNRLLVIIANSAF